MAASKGFTLHSSTRGHSPYPCVQIHTHPAPSCSGLAEASGVLHHLLLPLDPALHPQPESLLHLPRWHLRLGLEEEVFE